MKNTDCIAGGKNLVGDLVIQLHAIHIQGLALGGDHLHRPVDNGQGPQAEKVHLQQTQVLQADHVHLGGDVAGLGMPVQRDVIGEVTRGDHHPGGVGGGVAVHPFQHAAQLEQIPVGLIHSFGLCKVGIFLHGPLDSHLGTLRDQFGDAVSLGEAHSQHPGHIAHHRAGLELTEGDYLAHGLLTVQLLDIVDHLAPPLLAEVYIDIGHGDPVLIQEALKQQVIAQRVNVGNPQAIRHQRARSAAPAGPHGDILAPGVTDEIHNDQEIAGVMQVPDHLQLVVQAGLDFRRHLMALGQPFLRLGAQVFIRVLAGRRCGDREPGQVQFAQLQFHITLLGNGHGILQRLGRVLKQLEHLVTGLEIKLGCGVAQAVGVVPVFPGAQAEHDVVGFPVFLAGIVAVVGGYQRQVQLPGQPDVDFHRRILLRDAVALQLQVKVTGKDLRQFQGRRFCALEPAFDSALLDRPLQAGRGAYQSRAVPAQQFLVYPGAVVEPFQVARRHQFHQVAQPLLVLGQQYQVVVVPPAASAAGLTAEAVLLGHVHFAADDRLDPGGHGGLMEFHHPEQVAVIREPHRVHFQIGHDVHQGLDRLGAVQQGKVGMVV